MQAIQTKYFGPTNSRGSRIVATCAAKRISVGYLHELNVEQNHFHAAESLRLALGWQGDGYGDLVSGCLRDGSYVHTMTGRGA